MGRGGWSEGGGVEWESEVGGGEGGEVDKFISFFPASIRKTFRTGVAWIKLAYALWQASFPQFTKTIWQNLKIWIPKHLYLGKINPAFRILLHQGAKMRYSSPKSERRVMLRLPKTVVLNRSWFEDGTIFFHQMIWEKIIEMHVEPFANPKSTFPVYKWRFLFGVLGGLPRFGLLRKTTAPAGFEPPQLNGSQRTFEIPKELIFV
jgi:hypothetical protein